MALYGKRQAGSNPDTTKNLSSVGPGESYVLLDGTEDLSGPVTASVAFARGHQGSSDNGLSFLGTGMSVDIDVEGANEDVDSEYTVLGSIAADANGNGSYTDVGRCAFLRLGNLGASSPAATPKVRVQG